MSIPISLKGGQVVPVCIAINTYRPDRYSAIDMDILDL